MRELAEVEPWVEVISFAECPHCNFVENLGDSLLDQDFDLMCNRCGKYFRVKAKTI